MPAEVGMVSIVMVGEAGRAKTRGPVFSGEYSFPEFTLAE
jgi:hypothetical protein